MLLNHFRRFHKGPAGREVILGTAVLVLTLAFVGCGDGPQTLTFPADAPVNWVQYVTPGGVEPLSNGGNGAVEQTFELDGKKGGKFTFRKVTLSFPPRAVSGEYTLTIEQPDPKVGIWDFRLEPDTGFDRPVTLTIDYAGFSNADDHTILWLDEAAGLWVDIGGSDHPSQGYCTVDLGHFSTYGVTDGTAGWE